jgi:hypothetical protein
MCDDHGAPRRPTQRLLRRFAYRLASPELERAVLDRAKPKGHDVENVVSISPSTIDVLPARTAHFPCGPGRSEDRALSAHNNSI